VGKRVFQAELTKLGEVSRKKSDFEVGNPHELLKFFTRYCGYWRDFHTWAYDRITLANHHGCSKVPE
jgi:hypothetical protein